MRHLIILILFNTFLWSTNLTKHEIYEAEDRVDIMLYFDTPYTKQIIKKQDSESTILIILPKMQSKYKISNHINSPIIQSFKAISYKNQTMLELQGVDRFSVEGVNTIDNYGLRLRVKPLLETNPKQYPNENTLQDKFAPNTFKTKDESDITNASIKVLLALFWIFAALFLLKTWILRKKGESISIPSWLSKKPEPKKEEKIKQEPKKKEEKKSTEIVIETKKVEEKIEPKKKEEKKSQQEDPFQIIFQKHIDKQNTVSLLEYNGNNYLILTGNTNMLLEMNAKTQAAIPANEQEIKNILEQSDQKFDEFIQLQNSKFNEYKRRASQDAPIALRASSS